MTPVREAVSKRPRVLVLTPYFLPSQQGGGSVRAVHHLYEGLREDFDLVVATGNRDIDRPLDPGACHEWRARSGMDVRYLPYGAALPGQLLTLLREPWDLIYLNSLLSLRFSALPLLLNRGRVPVLLAPRGELLTGALKHRRWQKHLYLAVLRTLGLLRGVHWQATSLEEATQLARHDLVPVALAADLPAPIPGGLPSPEPLPDGPLRLVYLSRIDRHKNLGFLLDVLRTVQRPVRLDIYGPQTDASYWHLCERQLASLPPHVSAHYHGAVAPAQVDGTLRQHEVFVLPTLGENNGYVIAEALLAGCLLLISDQTPWTRMQQPPLIRALSLERSQNYAQAIDDLAALDASQRLLLRQQAQELGRQAMSVTAPAAEHRRLFEMLTSRGTSKPPDTPDGHQS